MKTIKKHKYTSTTGIHFYWYGDFYLRTQKATAMLPDYALIQSNQTPNTESEFEGLIKMGCLEEVTRDEFLQAYIEAKNILDKLMEKKAETGCVHPYASVHRRGDFETCMVCGKVLCEG